jgi:FdhD protein
VSANPDGSTESFRIRRWTESLALDVDDDVSVEEPLEIRVRRHGERGATIAVTMRTPGRDADLAIGFLHGEGLLHAREEVVDAAPCRGAPNVVQVTVDALVPQDRFAPTGRFHATSSCGLCGRESLDAVLGALRGRRVTGSRTIDGAVLRSMPARLFAEQDAFRRAGGLHAAALATVDGGIVDVAEDVGRHNAVDKVLGRAWLDGRLPASDALLFLSGRAGFELVQKAVMAGCSVVASVGAPSSLAVRLAREAGLTLVGFVGERRFNVYSGPERVDV